MRDEKEGRSKQDQTNNKAKQHSTPEAVTFPKKNEPTQVGIPFHTLSPQLHNHNYYIVHDNYIICIIIYTCFNER